MIIWNCLYLFIVTDKEYLVYKSLIHEHTKYPNRPSVNVKRAWRGSFAEYLDVPNIQGIVVVVVCGVNVVWMGNPKIVHHTSQKTTLLTLTFGVNANGQFLNVKSIWMRSKRIHSIWSGGHGGLKTLWLINFILIKNSSFCVHWIITLFLGFRYTIKIYLKIKKSTSKL